MKSFTVYRVKATTQVLRQSSSVFRMQPEMQFCDTQHEAGTLMTDDEIIAEVSKYPAVTVILTGGEPSLWIDDALIDRLHEAGKYVCIETNGTRPLPESIDWVTCSPKQGVKLGITRMDEVKVVYEGQDISIYELLPAEHFSSSLVLVITLL